MVSRPSLGAASAVGSFGRLIGNPMHFFMAQSFSRRVVVLLLLATSPASAQIVGGGLSPTKQLDGASAGDRFAFAVAAGDANGDGYPDLAVTAQREDAGALADVGAVYLYSGRDGSLLHKFVGQYDNGLFGTALAFAGDVDADGCDDLLVGEQGASPGGLYGAGAAHILSGRDGSLLHKFEGTHPEDFLGTAVAPAGDIDGDGQADFLVGAIGMDPNGVDFAGSVFLISGANGSILQRFNGTRPWIQYGASVACIGDMNGDGLSDVAIGAPDERNGGESNSGSIFIYTALTGELILRLDGASSFDHLGWAVSGVGDLTGDGRSDLLASAPNSSHDGRALCGAVYLYRGGDGKRIGAWYGPSQMQMIGDRVARLGDLDGDGLSEFGYSSVWASPGGYATAGSVYIHSGATLEEIHRLDGDQIGAMLGFSFVGAGDIDADGLAEVLVGAPLRDGAGGTVAGRAYLYRRDPFIHASSQTLSASSGGVVTFELRFPRVEGDRPYTLLASTSGPGPSVLGGLVVPLTPDPLLARTAAGQAPTVFRNAVGLLDRYGEGSASLALPPGLPPQTIGRVLWSACAVGPNAAYRVVSEATQVTVAP